MILQQRLYPYRRSGLRPICPFPATNEEHLCCQETAGRCFQAGDLRVVCELRMSLRGENKVSNTNGFGRFRGAVGVLEKTRTRKISDVPVLPEIGSTLFCMQNGKQRRRYGRRGEGYGYEPSVHGLNVIFTPDAFGLAMAAGRVL